MTDTNTEIQISAEPQTIPTNCLYKVDRMLFPGMHYTEDADFAKEWMPLAAAIMKAVEGVKGVRVGGQEVLVTMATTPTDWRDSAKATGACIREFVAADGVRVTMGVDSTLNLQAGSGAFPPDIRGDPVVTEAELGSEGSKYTVLRHGDINWIRIRRGAQFALRVRDNTNEVYAQFHGIDRYDTDPAMRRTAEWVPQDEIVSVPNVLGTVSEVPSPARLAFWIDGERHTLDVTGEPDSEQFMMVFADETSGQTTYGGGRYLWIQAPDEQGRVVLDFNRAYNPPCVWTPFATCPLPTRNNRLTVPIEAGEMDWAH